MHKAAPESSRGADLARDLTDKPAFESERLSIVNGVDVAGEDGILVFLRSDSAKDVMSTSKIVAVSKIIDEIMRQVQKGITKYAMGIKEVSHAASVGAIESLAIYDSSKSESQRFLFNKGASE